MIQPKNCRFTGCLNSELETMEEVDNGFCSRHKAQIDSDDHIILSCWSCNELIGTAHKDSLVKGTRIIDDYIFTKYCPHCDWDADLKALTFVTANNEVDKELSRAVNADGLLVGAKFKVVNNSRRKPEKVFD
jgi:hypothetical protein